MRFLVDTHVFIWMISNRDRVSPAVQSQLEDPENPVYYSAVLSWEIAIKRNRGKLHFSGSPGDVARRIGLVELPITSRHGEAAGELPLHHRDPFDRLLIAQAQSESLVLVSHDPALTKYDVAVLRV